MKQIISLFWHFYYIFYEHFEKSILLLSFGRAGTYTATVPTLNVTKTYTFTIVDEAPVKIAATVSDGESKSDFAEVESINKKS